MIDFIKSVLLEGGDLYDQHELKIVKRKLGRGNWVTVMDILIQKLILKRIKKQYPAHNTLSEEAEPRFSKMKEDLWVIDPLDGTTNAVFGFPHYGIAIAYMQNGKVTCAGMYDIPNKVLYWAKKGEGAFMQEVNSHEVRKLHVREGLLKDALVCVGSPYLAKNFKPNSKLMSKVYEEGARIVNTGSAVCDAKFVAEGKLSLYFEIGLKPWDIAAESLIVEEAGGRASDFTGNFDVFKSREIIWGNKEIVKEFLKLV